MLVLTRCASLRAAGCEYMMSRRKTMTVDRSDFFRGDAKDGDEWRSPSRMFALGHVTLEQRQNKRGRVSHVMCNNMGVGEKKWPNERDWGQQPPDESEVRFSR